MWFRSVRDWSATIAALALILIFTAPETNQKTVAIIVAVAFLVLCFWKQIAKFFSDLRNILKTLYEG